VWLSYSEEARKEESASDKKRVYVSNTGIFRFSDDDIYRKNYHSVLVMEMQPVEIPKFPTLHGEKAIKILYDFINELETQRGEELTEKQTTTLIKIAKGVISSIETETLSDTSDKGIKEMLFGRWLKKTIVKYIPKSVNRLLGR